MKKKMLLKLNTHLLRVIAIYLGKDDAEKKEIKSAVDLVFEAAEEKRLK